MSYPKLTVNVTVRKWSFEFDWIAQVRFGDDGFNLSGQRSMFFHTEDMAKLDAERVFDGYTINFSPLYDCTSAGPDTERLLAARR